MQIGNNLIEKSELNWSDVEIKLMSNGKSKKITFVIYQE